VLKDALELKAQEEAEHTFQPAINQRSKAIFRRAIGMEIMLGYDGDIS
jgi:hypothetical protein